MSAPSDAVTPDAATTTAIANPAAATSDATPAHDNTASAAVATATTQRRGRSESQVKFNTPLSTPRPRQCTLGFATSPGVPSSHASAGGWATHATPLSRLTSCSAPKPPTVSLLSEAFRGGGDFSCRDQQLQCAFEDAEAAGGSDRADAVPLSGAPGNRGGEGAVGDVRAAATGQPPPRTVSFVGAASCRQGGAGPPPRSRSCCGGGGGGGGEGCEDKEEGASSRPLLVGAGSGDRSEPIDIVHDSVRELRAHRERMRALLAAHERAEMTHALAGAVYHTQQLGT
ncbi:hypothetical protein FOA52_014694 [Chlamydomonas sp. UWO 241]|nr:hypothetical protein FOA52_014694 [Chlamydomonas sp. UWO 241]